jgi:hypothetical protein
LSSAKGEIKALRHTQDDRLKYLRIYTHKNITLLPMHFCSLRKRNTYGVYST